MFKNHTTIAILMQVVQKTTTLRNEIENRAILMGLDKPCFTKMLDYTIEIFESQGLGKDYYGYHNINHELEVTFVTLIASVWKSSLESIRLDDLKYLYTAALFHDFDPQKSVDKPHEDSVVKFLLTDEKVRTLITDAGLDINLVIALILRTTYPWSGQLKESTEEKIKEYFEKSPITKNNPQQQEHYLMLGWFLSIVDRISGYALGDFQKGMEMAKMNAHALAWHPSVIVQRAVAYFEDLLNNETEMCERVLESLPKQMRKNFMNNVLGFMNLRQQEIQVRANFVFDNLGFVPTIDSMTLRNDGNFIDTLLSIYDELPKPLQIGKDTFAESVRDPNTILNTLRLGGTKGEIIGFAKGGPLENYKLRSEIRDENWGLANTVFLEPIAIKMGYWGHGGGHELRHMFIMLAHTKKYKHLTSFALRGVIEKRSQTYENAQFVRKFDPERWDYYRIPLYDF